MASHELFLILNNTLMPFGIQMLLQVTFCHKPLSALKNALVGALTRVYPHMRLKVSTLGESLVTSFICTYIWLFASMSANMDL